MGSDPIMPGQMLPAWHEDACDLCGCTHQLTRTNSRVRKAEELCEGCGAHQDGFNEGWAAAEAQQATHAALLAALGAPEGVGVVEWAAAMKCAGDAVTSWCSDYVTGNVIREAAQRIEALRAPPRPLPDGPGWWWGSWGRLRDMAPIWVDEDDRLGGRMALHLHSALAASGEHRPLTDATWLTGPDGKAVRCEPPQGGSDGP